MPRLLTKGKTEHLEWGYRSTPRPLALFRRTRADNQEYWYNSVMLAQPPSLWSTEGAA